MGRSRKPDPNRNTANNYLNRQLLQIDRDLWTFAFKMGRFSSHQPCRHLKDRACRASVEGHLKKLYTEGMLLRYRPGLEKGEGTHPFVYQFSPRAIKIMQKAGWKASDLKYLKKLPTGNTTHLKHRLAANDAVVEFIHADERGNSAYWAMNSARVAQNAAEKVRMDSEICEDIDYMILRPDALLSVTLDMRWFDDKDGEWQTIKSSPVPVYLEVDRGTEMLEQVRRQINYYIAAYLSDQWAGEKPDFPLVCWIFEKASMAERVHSLMHEIMKDPRDVVVRTTRSRGYRVESDFSLAYFNTCITTKDAFYGAESIASDRIWYTNRSPERLSLNVIAGMRFDAKRKHEEELRLKELFLKRRRETIEV
jgi:hypothetical protein